MQTPVNAARTLQPSWAPPLVTDATRFLVLAAVLTACAALALAAVHAAASHETLARTCCFRVIDAVFHACCALIVFGTRADAAWRSRPRRRASPPPSSFVDDVHGAPMWTATARPRGTKTRD